MTTGIDIDSLSEFPLKQESWTLTPGVARVSLVRYNSSIDPRGQIPCYQYLLKGGQHYMLMDCDTGFVHWNQLLKALDIAQYGVLKLLNVSPKVKNHVKRIRGGFLRCQGLWISHELSLMIAQRLAHSIADQLVPWFGKDFSSTCIAPGQPEFGRLLPCTATASTLFARPLARTAGPSKSSSSLTSARTALNDKDDKKVYSGSSKSSSMDKKNRSSYSPLPNKFSFTSTGSFASSKIPISVKREASRSPSPITQKRSLTAAICADQREDQFHHVRTAARASRRSNTLPSLEVGNYSFSTFRPIEEEEVKPRRRISSSQTNEAEPESRDNYGWPTDNSSEGSQQKHNRAMEALFSIIS